jgi:hypothetical protein
VKWCRIERWGVQLYVVEGDISGSLSGVHIQMRMWESGGGRGGEMGRRIAGLTLDLSSSLCLFVISRVYSFLAQWSNGYR